MDQVQGKQKEQEVQVQEVLADLAQAHAWAVCLVEALAQDQDQVLVQEVQVRQVKELVELVQEVQACDQSHLGLLLEAPLGGSGPV